MALQPIDSVLPLPNRVALSILFGIWGWGTIVEILNKIHIDVNLLIKYSSSPTGSPITESKRRESHKPIYAFAVAQSITYFVLLTAFWITQSMDSALADLLSWMSVVALAVGFIYPGSPGKSRFLSTFNEVKFGHIDLDNRLPCILLSDALTSYGRVIGDAAVMTGMVVMGHSLKDGSRREVLQPYISFCVSCWPNTVRMRQCLIDYFASGDSTHLANLLKYLSGVFVSVAWFAYKSGSVKDIIIGESTLWYIWILFVTLNSVYTFIWDIRFDWNLNIFQIGSSKSTSKLRPATYFPWPFIYYFAVCMDLGLRFIWVLRLLPQYDLDSEWAQFALGSVEIFRRWMWALFRIESEWAKTPEQRLPAVELERWASED